jgi:hypothetical protein
MKLDEFLKDPEAKKEYDAAVAAAIDTEVKGLKDKNKELLGKAKNAEAKVDEIQAQLDEISAEGSKSSADIEKQLKLRDEKHARELAKIREGKESADKRLNQLLIDNGLTKALTEAGVAPQLMEAATALIKTKIKHEIVDIDGEPVAQFDGKPVGDFVKSWTQGDHGKHFTAAPKNDGGGAKGSDGKSQGSVKTITRSDFSALDPAAQMKHVKDGGKITD